MTVSPSILASASTNFWSGAGDLEPLERAAVLRLEARGVGEFDANRAAFDLHRRVDRPGVLDLATIDIGQGDPVEEVAQRLLVLRVDIVRLAGVEDTAIPVFGSARILACCSRMRGLLLTFCWPGSWTT